MFLERNWFFFWLIDFILLNFYIYCLKDNISTLISINLERARIYGFFIFVLKKASIYVSMSIVIFIFEYKTNVFYYFPDKVSNQTWHSTKIILGQIIFSSCWTFIHHFESKKVHASSIPTRAYLFGHDLVVTHE